ncbi:conserved hypothetical protein [Vibrio crassostreae]|jgi:hypothetical protein|uniref:Uncharacterized protein n=1 Tax=Vibrio crassostreae TaxID=246167 RepID=A0ABP1WUI0_9VIBR|nr:MULTISPECIES: hypothetical protein [Vibrio]TCL30434.1 hypothetical protein EDB52_101721 [Vibrio crassostreae]TKE88823.1 hypothetical protein FCV53_21305 [Vibrio sp. F12]CAK1709844.1 conserved hypothetical protein [Vibrio crassostreae]CAK1711267.1 conserved hypothetical protein [Vibrio crassostreae]CAK1719340.1 conserved hypothetical protein [Vibrio crassostreae]
MAITLTELRAMVTIQGVSSSLDEQIYHSLTYNDENNAQTACQSAARWCYAYLGQKNALSRLYSEDDKEVLAEGMTQRAIYELGEISEFDFDDRKDEALALINALLGLNHGTESGAQYTGAAIARDQESHIIVPYRSASHRRYR